MGQRFCFVMDPSGCLSLSSVLSLSLQQGRPISENDIEQLLLEARRWHHP